MSEPLLSSLFGAAKKFVAAIGIALSLFGCAQPWEPDIDRDVYACREYGFYPGSAEFEKCLSFVRASRAKRGLQSFNPVPLIQAPRFAAHPAISYLAS